MDFSSLENKSIIVTGGGGFLGFEICKQLRAIKNLKVISVSRGSYPKLKEEGITEVRCDLSKLEEVKSAFKDIEFDAIIHCAAKAGVWGDYNSYYKANFQSTENLVHLCLDKNVKHFIYTSTPSVVFGAESLSGADEDTPYPSEYFTHYAKTKMMAESLVLSQKNFNSLAIRPHLIWGKGDPHILPRLTERLRKGRLKIVGDGQNTVDIIHVKNAAFAHLLALKKSIISSEHISEAFFVGQKNPVKLWSFIAKMLGSSLDKLSLKAISFDKAYKVGGLLERVYTFFKIKSDPPMTRFIALQLAKDHYFSHQKAERELGYHEIISTNEGLAELFS